MPVFTAAGENASNTASIWRRTISTLHAWMPRTPSGFCAVMHVIALVPCTPSAAKVLRSECIKHRLHLAPHDFHTARLDAAHALGILRRNARDRARSVHAQCGEGLAI